MVPTDPAPGHDVYWRCLKTSAGLIFTVILASCQWGYLLFYRNPEDQRKPCADNKQEEAEIKQGLVAEWPPLPTKKWKEEVLPCSHMLTLKQGVSRSCLDRSPVWSTEWKEIKQHISASLQLLGQSYWYCRSAEYRWGYWVYLVSEGNAFKPFTLWKKKTSIRDHLGMIYYITDIQAQCIASIISHLEAVAVRKWWFTMPVSSTTYQRGGGAGGGWWD